ncbi:MAG: hypothetical protein ABR999_09030 [Methanoregula sp.]|jgi:hypothetical protein|uniref:hypothetical protein n=1 Tax=Methanoregula sp. TaxID=2052170 RepID=UPI003D1388E3
MHFFFDVSIPANTPETAPNVQVLAMTYGEIRHVSIAIPVGHQALAHLQLLYHSFQVYPLSQGQDYHGDNSQIEFDDQFALDEAPYEINAVGWNTDTVYPHSFLVGIEVELPDGMTISASAKTLADLKSMIGSSIGG